MLKPLMLFVFAFGLLLFSCKEGADTPTIDIQDANIEVIRFDAMMQDIQDPNDLERLSSLKQNHPIFFELFFSRILPLRGKNMDSLTHYLAHFNQDERIQELYRTVDSTYTDFGSLEKNLKRAFAHYRHYFEDTTSHKIYTFLSEYSFQNFIFPDADGDGIGIGLDMFLGSSYPYKKLDPHNPAFSDYLTRSFDKNHIVKKVMESVLVDRLGGPKGNKMVDFMLHNGKKLYMLEKIMPQAHDTILMEYSKEQMEWTNDNELEIYSFLLDKELFYESKMMRINKYVSPSPTSPGMPDIAPGRTANYIGWQIIKAYMKKNPETSFQELIDMKDAQVLLDKSAYKPKRKKK